MEKQKISRHEEQINALIPEAARVADDVAGPTPKGDARKAWAATWDRAFHARMDEQALALGLRRLSYQKGM